MGDQNNARINPADSPLEFRRELESVLASREFEKAPALTRLLSFLGERALTGDTGGLKEVVIGHALYDRPADYDPKLDSVVRVNANRLRLKLEEHYRLTSESGARIVLPKGSYAPHLEFLHRRSFIHANEPAALREEIAATPTDEPIHPTDAEEQAGDTPLWVLREDKQRRPTLGYVLVSVVGLLLCLVLWLTAKHPTTSAAAETVWRVRPFARVDGSQQYAEFSPDGKNLVFTVVGLNDRKQTVYLQSLASDEAQRIASGTRPAWSPDGKTVAFLRSDDPGKKDIVLHDLATKRETVLAQIAGYWPWLCATPHLSWSPDGRTIYTAASEGEGGPCRLIAIDVASHQIRRMTNSVGSNGDLEPSVSPDGSSVAFMRNGGFRNIDIYLADAHSGALRQLTHDHADFVGLAWTSDGKSLIAASNRIDGIRKLWRIPVDGGDPVALTDGAAEPTFPSVSPNVQQISFTEFHISAPIWRTDDGRQLRLLDNQSLNSAPSVSPDGKRFLYSSNRSGRSELWISAADGGGALPVLRHHVMETGPGRWSPDGKQIVFECRAAGPTHICASATDGSNLRQLTSGTANETLPSWSRDGKRIYFTSNATGQLQIASLDVASGKITTLTEAGAYRAIESWDGQWLYVARGQPLGGIVVLPVLGTAEERREAEKRPLLLALGTDTMNDWDACKGGLIFRPSSNAVGVPELSLFEPATGQTKHLLALSELPEGTELTLSVMPDGRNVIYTASSTHAELNIMTAQKLNADHAAAKDETASAVIALH